MRALILAVMSAAFVLGCNKTKGSGLNETPNESNSRLISIDWMARINGKLDALVGENETLKQEATRLSFDSGTVKPEVVSRLTKLGERIIVIVAQFEAVVDERAIFPGQQKIVGLEDTPGVEGKVVIGLTKVKANLQGLKEHIQTNVIAATSALGTGRNFEERFAKFNLYQSNVNDILVRVNAIKAQIATWNQALDAVNSGQGGISGGIATNNPCTPTQTECESTCPENGALRCRVFDCNGLVIPKSEFTRTCTPPVPTYRCSECSRSDCTGSDGRYAGIRYSYSATKTVNGITTDLGPQFQSSCGLSGLTDCLNRVRADFRCKN